MASKKRAATRIRGRDLHEAEGGNYLGELRRALEHLEAARDFTSYSTIGADCLIRAVRRAIKEAGEET